MTKIKQLIKDYENGKDCGTQILDEYHKMTSGINQRHQLGERMYPNLFKFIKRMVKVLIIRDHRGA